MTEQKTARGAAFTVKLLERVVAMLESINNAMETFMVRIDPSAWTREKIRDTQQHLDYLERM